MGGEPSSLFNRERLREGRKLVPVQHRAASVLLGDRGSVSLKPVTGAGEGSLRGRNRLRELIPAGLAMELPILRYASTEAGLHNHWYRDVAAPASPSSSL